MKFRVRRGLAITIYDVIIVKYPLHMHVYIIVWYYPMLEVLNVNVEIVLSHMLVCHVWFMIDCALWSYEGGCLNVMFIYIMLSC